MLVFWVSISVVSDNEPILFEVPISIFEDLLEGVITVNLLSIRSLGNKGLFIIINDVYCVRGLFDISVMVRREL